MKNFLVKLQALNCRYNFKAEKNGRCYSTSCAMNTDPEIKLNIKNTGCSVYKRTEVQNLINETGGENEKRI